MNYDLCTVSINLHIIRTKVSFLLLQSEVGYTLKSKLKPGDILEMHVNGIIYM